MNVSVAVPLVLRACRLQAARRVQRVGEVYKFRTFGESTAALSRSMAGRQTHQIDINR